MKGEQNEVHPARTSVNLALYELTDRQREVVRLVSLGCTIEEIAAILGVSRKTADHHRASAMKVIGINRATLLTRFAIAEAISPIGDRLTEEEEQKRRQAVRE